MSVYLSKMAATMVGSTMIHVFNDGFLRLLFSGKRNLSFDK